MPTAVYLIRNTVTQDIYVGASICCTRRWEQHKYAWKNSTNAGLLQQAYDQHGLSAFEFDILEYCVPEELGDKEKEWVEKLEPAYNYQLNMTKSSTTKHHPWEGSSCPMRKKFTVDNMTGSIQVLADHYGVNATTVYSRIAAGWTLEKALKTPNMNIPKIRAPKREHEVHTFKGVTGTVYQLCKHFGINQSTVVERVKRGWSLEDAITLPRKS